MSTNPTLPSLIKEIQDIQQSIGSASEAKLKKRLHRLELDAADISERSIEAEDYYRKAKLKKQLQDLDLIAADVSETTKEAEDYYREAERLLKEVRTIKRSSDAYIREMREIEASVKDHAARVEQNRQKDTTRSNTIKYSYYTLIAVTVILTITIAVSFFSRYFS